MNLKNFITIIDDGLSNDVYNIGKIVNSIEITPELQIYKSLDGDRGANLHGSTCAAIIKKNLPCEQFVSVKILNNNKGTRNQLIKAIKWCVDNNVKIINLSLGTISFRDFNLLNKCMEYASNKGIIIVAACNNDRIYTCPASFDNVIGVKCDITGELKENQYVYIDSPLDGIDIIANATHKLVDTKGEICSTSICNSYAAPEITSLVYRIVEKYPNIRVEEVKLHLRENAVVLKNDYLNTLIRRNSNQNKSVDIPIVFFYDFTDFYGGDISKFFCKYFRNKGYYSVAIIDSAFESSKHDGIISLRQYYDAQNVNNSILEDVYTTFGCDIFICCTNIINKFDVKLNSIILADILILVVDNFDVDFQNIMKMNSESEIIIFSYIKDICIKNYNNCRVFYDKYELFIYILNMLTT